MLSKDNHIETIRVSRSTSRSSPEKSNSISPPDLRASRYHKHHKNLSHGVPLNIQDMRFENTHDLAQNMTVMEPDGYQHM